MSAPLLSARRLVKSYGDRRVVDELDLECRAGEVLGLLGPNGAGKTTTLRMLYGFVTPDSGTIEYEGKDFAKHRDELKRIIGVCTQDDTLDHDLTVAQNLYRYATYFRPRPRDLASRIEELLERFGLASYRDHSPHALSGGYKKRLMIARSIVHRPRILFLDEPTTGLDPRARVDVWELVSALRSEGMGIILTTHYMDEAERLSDELLVIDEGRAKARGTTKDVLGSILGEHVVVVPAGAPDQDAIRAFLEEHAIPTSVVLGELHAPVCTADLARLTERFPDAQLTVRPPTLDDLFLELSRRRGTA
ncbi:MAG TPA: ABC transporter ATP-binding protein [Sandaracinaceae bacterium]